jgi:copper chaperone NosL
MIKNRSPIFVLFIALFLVSCEPTVQAIDYGHDGCSYCRMTIVETFYGSEILTKKGKAYKFDSVECLAAFIIKEEVPANKIQDLYFTDFENAGKLFPLDEMIFVQAKKLKSPMGLNLSAYRNQKTADDVAMLYFGETLSWDQVKSFVETAWLK